MLEIDQKKAVEIAEEQRIIELAGTRVERTEADRRVKQADITARQEIEKTEVGRDQALETARLARRRALEQIEVARAQALQEAEIAAREEIERARIASERGLDEARVGRDLALRKLEVARERDVETALMDKAIALFQKSLEESAAKVEAEALRARAAEAEERVTTARDSEAARRRTSIEVMLAQKDAEEKRIAAQAEQVRAAVAAEAQKLLYEAENVLTDGARYGLFRRRLLDRIEGIVRESVKPMEKIEGIRILQVDGLSGGGGGRGDGRSPTDEVINSALRYRVQAPMIDQVLKEIGIEGGSLSRLPRPDARGQRHAARRQGGGRRQRAEGRGRPAQGRSRLHLPQTATRVADRRKSRWQRSTPPASSTPPRPRSGRACATSTGCPAGIRPSARAASRTASRPTRSAASATSASATATASASSCWACRTTTCSAPTRSWNRPWGWRTTSPR